MVQCIDLVKTFWIVENGVWILLSSFIWLKSYTTLLTSGPCLHIVYFHIHCLKKQSHYILLKIVFQRFHFCWFGDEMSVFHIWEFEKWLEAQNVKHILVMFRWSNVIVQPSFYSVRISLQWCPRVDPFQSLLMWYCVNLTGRLTSFVHVFINSLSAFLICCLVVWN